ncbi:hypothetical protein BZA70DRAFT_311967 [Myxozyma melibiosi]|uniref:Uncharacterized protein n=1 Tax=Myxozyma melibiosi TaxID=54550 RepID=A0ABR1F1T8_9ASCO
MTAQQHVSTATHQNDIREADTEKYRDRKSAHKATGARIGKNALRILSNKRLSSCSRVMWDSATLSKSPYPLKPDFTQKAVMNRPRIGGFVNAALEPLGRADSLQHPSPRGSLATARLTRRMCFRDANNEDVLNPTSNLAKEEAHQIDRPDQPRPP